MSDERTPRPRCEKCESTEHTTNGHFDGGGPPPDHDPSYGYATEIVTVDDDDR